MMTSQCGDEGCEDELDAIALGTDAKNHIRQPEEVAFQEASAAANNLDSLGRSPDTSQSREPSPEPVYKRAPSKFSKARPSREEDLSSQGGVDVLKRVEGHGEREEREEIEREAAGGALQELSSGYRKVIASLTQRVDELQSLHGDGAALTTQCDWNDVAARNAAQVEWWLSEKEGYVQNLACLESQVVFLTRKSGEAEAVTQDVGAKNRQLQRRVAILDANFETMQTAFQGALKFNQTVTAERDHAQGEAKFNALENERLRKIILELESKAKKENLVGEVLQARLPAT